MLVIILGCMLSQEVEHLILFKLYFARNIPIENLNLFYKGVLAKTLTVA